MLELPMVEALLLSVDVDELEPVELLVAEPVVPVPVPESALVLGLAALGVVAVFGLVIVLLSLVLGVVAVLGVVVVLLSGVRPVLSAPVVSVVVDGLPGLVDCAYTMPARTDRPTIAPMAVD